MTKKGPLSKAERFYIENHVHLDINDLCKDLDRAQSSIKKHLKSINKELQPETKKPTRIYDQFARNDKGSTVMTENASIEGDDFRESKTPPRTSRCTTRIR